LKPLTNSVTEFISHDPCAAKRLTTRLRPVSLETSGSFVQSGIWIRIRHLVFRTFIMFEELLPPPKVSSETA